jgi:hypothetical protein
MADKPRRLWQGTGGEPQTLAGLFALARRRRAAYTSDA